MKNAAIGCAGVVLGLALALILAITSNLWFSNPGAQEVAAVSSGQPDITVSASAAFINSQVQQMARQRNLAQQVQVALVSPDRVNATMAMNTKVGAQPVTANVTITTRITVLKGRVVLTLDKVEVAGMSVPPVLVSDGGERLRALAEEQINQLIQRGTQGTLLRLTGVLVSPDEITGQFKYGP